MKKLDDAKLEIILIGHEIWMDTNKKEGKQANLMNFDLRGVCFYTVMRDLKRKNDLRKVLLNGSNLEGVDLEGFNLEYGSLVCANLENTNLNCANLSHANLKKANLKKANLESADLESADLSHANLEEANLKSANLDYTKLYKTNLQKANIVEHNRNKPGELSCHTTFRGADLKQAIFSKNISLNYFV
jgi:uncharacterized protein YjbI with pentapeptide repeats